MKYTLIPSFLFVVFCGVQEIVDIFRAHVALYVVGGGENVAAAFAEGVHQISDSLSDALFVAARKYALRVQSPVKGDVCAVRFFESARRHIPAARLYGIEDIHARLDERGDEREHVAARMV